MEADNREGVHKVDDCDPPLYMSKRKFLLTEIAALLFVKLNTSRFDSSKCKVQSARCKVFFVKKTYSALCTLHFALNKRLNTLRLQYRPLVGAVMIVGFKEFFEGSFVVAIFQEVQSF